MKATKWALAAAVVLIGLAVPRAARADIVEVSISDVSFNGKSVCGPSGTALCTQTVSASYEWNNATNSYVAGTLAYTESGALGSSFTTLATPYLRSGTGVEFDLFGGGGDTFFILAEGASGLPTGTYPVVFDIFGGPAGDYSGDLECSAVPCSADFSPVGPYGDGGAFATGGTVTVSEVSATPEPSSIPLLGLGLLGLVSTVWRKRLA